MDHQGSRRTAIFPGLLATFGLLYLWRLSGIAPLEAVTSHVSNFYLSGAALTLACGPRAFVEPPERSRPLAAAAALVVLNLGPETVLPLIGIDDEVNRAAGDVNTSDPMDAVFGLAAVAMVLSLLARRHHLSRSRQLTTAR